MLLTQLLSDMVNLYVSYISYYNGRYTTYITTYCFMMVILPHYSCLILMWAGYRLVIILWLLHTPHLLIYWFGS